TFYAGATGAPTAIGPAGEDRVRQVSYWHSNVHGPESDRVVEGFHKKFNDDYSVMASYTGFRMLGEAIRKAKSTDPTKVAFAMEGLRVPSLNGEVEMRAKD